MPAVQLRKLIHAAYLPLLWHNPEEMYKIVKQLQVHFEIASSSSLARRLS